MDAAFAGEPGCSDTGQYVPWFTQRSGTTEFLAFSEYQSILGSLSNQDRVENPRPQTIAGKQAYVVRITTPIINRRTKELVGAVGVNVDISFLQPILEEAIATTDYISIASVYTNDGTIIASYAPVRIGRKLREADAGLYSAHTDNAVNAVLNGKSYQLREYSDDLDDNMEIMFQPFRIGTAATPWSVMIGVTNTVVLKRVNEMRVFTVILMAFGVVLSSLIVFFVAGNITKPIISVAMTLKDISEGEGDLTKSINSSSRDEIGELARYFNLILEKIKNLVITGLRRGGRCKYHQRGQ
jgi:methyl-accepting chemotaxis protein